MPLNQLLRHHMIWAMGMCVFVFLFLGCLFNCVFFCARTYVSVNVCFLNFPTSHIYLVYLWKNLGRSVEIAITPKNWRNIGCIILSHTNKMRVDQPESGLPVNNNPARPHQIWIVEKRTLKKDEKEEKRTLPKRCLQLRDAKTRKLCECIYANGFGPVHILGVFRYS